MDVIVDYTAEKVNHNTIKLTLDVHPDKLFTKDLKVSADPEAMTDVVQLEDGEKMIDLFDEFGFPLKVTIEANEDESSEPDNRFVIDVTLTKDNGADIADDYLDTHVPDLKLFKFDPADVVNDYTAEKKGTNVI